METGETALWLFIPALREQPALFRLHCTAGILPRIWIIEQAEALILIMVRLMEKAQLLALIPRCLSRGNSSLAGTKDLIVMANAQRD
jgi:hypothetical protein